MKHKLLRLASLLLLPSAAIQAADASKPNIVFIFADDLGWGDISCHGAENWLKTPHIDRLASEGTDFQQFNVLSPVCSPSRAATMTGCYPARHSIHTALNSDPAANRKSGQCDWLDPRAPMLPRYLQAAGYHTAHIGKWHLGEGAPHFVGAPEMADYGFAESLVYHGPGPKIQQRNIGAEGARAIGRMREKQPFFLNVWLHETHTKHFPTQESMDAFKHLDPRRQVYAATLRDGDNNVGMILDALKKSGLDQNTIVMFSSDNGPAGAPYSPADRAPNPADGNIQKGFDIFYSSGSAGGLRGRKARLYEGGVRVPFIVRWPGHTAAGSKNDSTVFTAVDLLPTICAAAGARLPADFKGDGENLLPAFEGKPAKRSQPLFWKAAGVGRDADSWCQWSMREGDWKLYADAQTTRIELFDLSKDRSEKRDVSKDHPETVARMRTQLVAWIASLPASPNPACVSRAQAGQSAPPAGENTPGPAAARRATPEQRAASFKKWDTNGDGALSLDEYKAALPGQEQLGERLAKFDKNSDGRVTLVEFAGPQPEPARAKQARPQ